MVGDIQKTLGPTDIRGFGVTGYDVYQSASVTYHLNPIHGQDLPLEYSDETVTKDCFLRVMIRGTYSLFELTFADRAYYFISDQGGPMKELVIRAKLADDVIILDEEYKSMLSDLMTRENITDQAIARLKYTPGRLAFVVSRLNQAHGGSRAVAVAPTGPKSKSVQLDAFAGGLLYAFPTHYLTVYGTGKMPSTLSARLGVGLRYILPPRFAGWSLGFSLGYSFFNAHASQTGGTALGYSYSYDSIYYSETQRAANSMLLTNLYLMYEFAQREKVGFYFRVGANLNYLLGNGDNATITSNYTETSYLHYLTYAPTPDSSSRGSVQLIHLAKKTVCFNVSAGVESGRHRIELAYCTPMQLGGSGSDLSFTVSSFGLNYDYTFLK